MKSPQKIFLAAALLIVIVAAFFRLTGLELKPIHHDECVNYVFTRNLLWKNDYKYNSTAYHGPFIYYIDLPVVALAGFSKTTLRAAPAVCSLLTVVLVLLLARGISPPGALFAAAALALSPADIYYGKTYLHEVYFTIGFVGGVLTMIEANRTGKWWATVLFYVALALSFMNKETAAFHVVVFTAAIAAAWLVTRRFQPAEPFFPRTLLGFGGWEPVAIGLSITALMYLGFYSSFGHYPKGLLEFFRSYMPWFQTGVSAPTHVKPWYYFPKLIGEYYWPVLPFALWGTVRSLRLPRPRGIALAIIAFGLTTIYSVIPYKTPWCIISMGVSWILLSAEGFGDLWRVLPRREAKAALAVVALAMLGYYGYFSYRVNFQEYDFNYNSKDEPIKHDIVYVQTQREYEKMYVDLDRIAEVDGRGREIPIALSSGSKNPGRFYLHPFNIKKIKVYFEKLSARDKIAQPVALIRENEMKEYQEHLDGEYHTFGVYPVFPGWKIHLMVKEDLWQKLAQAGMIENPIPPS